MKLTMLHDTNSYTGPEDFSQPIRTWPQRTVQKKKNTKGFSQASPYLCQVGFAQPSALFALPVWILLKSIWFKLFHVGFGLPLGQEGYKQMNNIKQNTTKQIKYSQTTTSLVLGW